MSLYIAQEFLGVLLVLAGLVGTILVFGIAVILFQEGIRRTPRGAKTRIKPFRGSPPKSYGSEEAGSVLSRNLDPMPERRAISHLELRDRRSDQPQAF